MLATGRGLTAGTAAAAFAGGDAADAAAAGAGCLGSASTGLPVRGALWNASICASERARSRSGNGVP